MRKSKLKIALLALLLLITQSALAVHELQHQTVDHAEWCKGLGSSEHKVLGSDTSFLMPALFENSAKIKDYVVGLATPTAIVYLSRAPPLR